MHPQSLAEEEVKTEPEVVEGMDISTRSKAQLGETNRFKVLSGLKEWMHGEDKKDTGSAERAAPKRKAPSPQHSSNGHSPQETPPSPVKKKKKHSLVNNNNKDQTELRHGPFYYMKQPQTSDPVDLMPQDGRNDFYCWVCHREGQVLCCELCPRVYHAKCLKLNEEPEGDWFCPECEKITVAECIETQSKAMTLLTIEQLSYLLKFALQKMKQPGTEPFQKPVSLDQHPDYAEYIFHPMDLSTLEKNVKKKMYGCTEAFLADVKWILHNCIIYNGDSTPCDIPSSGNKQTGKVLRSSSRRCQRRQVTAASTSPKGTLEVHKGNPWRSQNFATPQMPHWSRFSRNHKLTQTAKVLIKICEHEMNEIEVCPECYLSACQKRESWFCEPCSHPHPLVWAKLKGFPFWPAKALRDKEGQVDARFFGQHDRAWVPMNNCYLMSKEIPFSVKKTKSIFNSAMQEMEIYVENIRRKFGVFNYAPFRTPYTPNNQYQMLVDTGNPSAGTVKTEKPEKIKLNFDMTGSPKILLGKHSISGAGSGRRISLSDMPRSPMSTNSSVHTGSDAEPDTDKKTASTHFSASEESMDFIDKSTASPASTKTGQAGSQPESPKPFSPQASTTVSIKQEKTPTTGSILNLNLDRSKAEMELKELSESVLQQSTPTRLISPKRQIRSRFQLNLDKTIESCKAQLGINEISDDVYKATEHSDSEETEKSDSSDSESISDDEQKPKTEQDDGEEKESNKTDKESSVKKKPKPPVQQEVKEEAKSTDPPVEKIESTVKETKVMETEKDTLEKVKSVPPTVKEKVKGKDETDSPTVHLGLDSDSENELVIDLEADQSGRQGLKGKKEIKEPTPKQDDAAETVPAATSITEPQPETPILTRSSTQIPATAVTATPNATCTIAIPIAVTGSPVRKQRPLLPKETVPGTPTPSRVVWNSSNKFQTSSQKWHMQKVQRQQQQQQTQPQSPTTPPPATAAAAPTPPPTAATPPTAVATPPTVVASPTPTAALTATTAVATAIPTTLTPLTPTQSSPGTRYQTRQAVKAVQQKEITQSSTSTSTITLVTSTQPISMVTSSGSGITHTTSINTDLPIATASADVAADIAKYTGKMMDAIKGTMTEIYNDLSKTTAGSTIAEIRRLRIEIEKLQWLHQQELSEMKHNLELTMAEMRQSLEQERDRLIAEVKKQMEMEKQQSVDETKKKQWCANCKKEAIFYCCWNTSYCDYPCQQAHWPEHMKSCTQSATATQQETDTEPGTDAANKPIQPNPAQLSPTETANGSKEKDNSADKSKECVTIATTVPSTQPIKLVQVPQTTTFMPATQPTITIPVVVSPTGGAVAMRPGVQYVQTTMPVQVRRV